ncbi:MAG: DUF5696 domain-containing protein [Bryobacteraceae bacterium]
MIRTAFTLLTVSTVLAALSGDSCAQTADDSRFHAIAVTHADGNWTIAGKKNTAVLNDRTLALSVNAGGKTWNMVPSSADDMVIGLSNDEFRLKLADAGKIEIAPYRTGYKTGVKVILDQFRNSGRMSGTPLDLRIVLTLCLEGNDEDLVADAMAIENGLTARELNWPKEVDGREVDFTVIPSDDGTLLPRDWPKAYHPIHRAAGDHSVIQSHLIETWAMSWWGFEKDDAAMMLIVETPDDAGYTFSHPAGGPTRMGPSWRAQLNRFAYPRSVRMVFLPRGNYVDMCKRYRRYVMDSGLYVSLKDKIAQRPVVQDLIGRPVVGMRVLRNVKPGSATYDTKDHSKNYRLVTFDQNIQKLRELKAQGFDHVNVSLSGWLKEGYDRQTPDALPPTPKAGGWEGLKAFFDACKELGDTCWLHDQYRDYYLDAPSWNPEFAVQEEDNLRPSTAFPGTRFKDDWKDGYIPFMNHWDGGTQAYLNNRFMLGHMVKNYEALFAHGIHPQGSYQDVFGYIPPDQDFNPEHPSTRTDSMRSRIDVFHWVAKHLGIVGTEDGSDWVVPYVDCVTSRMNRSPSNGNDTEHEDAIPIPLYELVYHDAIVTTYASDNLRGLLHASAPEWHQARSDHPVDMAGIRRMAALHQRVGLWEMISHEFLDKHYRRERTRFADGTTVTVDWDKNVATITPELQLFKN